MRSPQQSLKEYGRGIIGGFLFSLPLLFTMEVWWAGYIANYLSLIIYIFFTFLLLLGYNRFAGMRQDSTFKEVVIDSVEEMGLGLILSTVILWLIGRVEFYSMSVEEIIGKVTVEAMTVAIGISIGTAQLSSENDDRNRGMKESDTDHKSLGKFTVLSICGGVIVGGNLAPTEEIVMIAVEISAFKAFLLVLSALFLSALVFFFIDFKGTGSPGSSGKKVQNIVLQTSFIYMVSFSLSAIILYFFGRFHGNSFDASVFMIVVLTLPTTLGASAGRLLIK